MISYQLIKYLKLGYVSLKLTLHSCAFVHSQLIKFVGRTTLYIFLPIKVSHVGVKS